MPRAWTVAVETPDGKEIDSIVTVLKKNGISGNDMRTECDTKDSHQWIYRLFISSKVQQRKIHRLIYDWGTKHRGWKTQIK